jgi:hypothetical protein
MHDFAEKFKLFKKKTNTSAEVNYISMLSPSPFYQDQDPGVQDHDIVVQDQDNFV